MIKIAYLSFDADVADSLAETYAGISQPPMYIDVKGVYLNTDADQSMKVMAIYEFADDKEEAASEFLEQRYAEFYNVAGAEYRFESWVDTQSLLTMVADGMSATDVLHTVAISI